MKAVSKLDEILNTFTLPFAPTDAEVVRLKEQIMDFSEQYSQQQARAKDELIEELDSYIKFIGKELSNHEVLAWNRGIRASQEKIEEGKRRRERINALRIAAGIKTEER